MPASAQPYTPHARVDQMAAQGRLGGIDAKGYKNVMSLAAVLFVLSMISFASCWAFIAFAGISHVFAFVLPYFGYIAWPIWYFIITCVALLCTFIVRPRRSAHPLPPAQLSTCAFVFRRRTGSAVWRLAAGPSLSSSCSPSSLGRACS